MFKRHDISPWEEVQAAWEALENLIQDLKACDAGEGSLQRVLQAVHEGTSADAVFYFQPGLSGGALPLVGDRGLSADWCRLLAQRLIDQTPDLGEQMLWSDLSALDRPGKTSRLPLSVAMVRACRSWPGWIVALSLDPARPLSSTDLKVMALARRLLAIQTRYARVFDSLKDALFGVIRCLTAAIDAKDPYTCGHSERVARIAMRLGQQMGLPGEAISDLYLAGLLHDIGKIGIRDEVLQKPGALTAEEYLHVQEHAVIGDRIVSNIKQLVYLRPGVRSHHERWDGAGYPDRLAGEAIPLMARIIAVADSCDAMISSRRYRPALPPAQIDQIMADGAGSQWDPQIIRHFLACRHEVYLMVGQRGLGQSVYTAVERVVSIGHDSAQLTQPPSSSPSVITTSN